MPRSYRFPAFLLLACLIGLSGCRTYGDYDSEAKTYEAIQWSLQQFSDELTQAEEDLRRLEEEAADVEALQPLTDRFHNLVEEHRSLIDQQRQIVEELSEDSGYRTLRRTYSSMVTEQRLLIRQYQRAIQNVQSVAQESAAGDVSMRDESQYVIEPLGFPRARQGESLTMSEALQAL